MLIFAGLGFWLRSQGPPVDADGGTATVLMVAALALGLTASVVVTMGTPRAAKILGNHQTWLIVRLALAEQPALVGFAAFYLGGTSVAFLAMLAWSLGLMALAMPTARDREAWDEQRRALERSQRHVR